MKLYKKKNLSMSHGMFVIENGKVIAVDRAIVNQANLLETLNQKLDFKNAHPKVVAEPNWDEFERKHIGTKIELDTPTPLLDQKIAESLKLMNEIDNHNNTENTEYILNNMFGELIEFISSKKVLGTDEGVAKFDTPTLGNPLEWTHEDIIRVVGDSISAGLINVE